ncbi:unnamed protein product [Cylicocyclus nassatus]|uniref:Uncharacterized protein n=1 Tax=Cylicocyclus nassatus TaxID=53992 RepID=A0AA36H7H9_CYLNA|nr:unnamed protein product [Cylicocyclus nassatus]
MITIIVIDILSYEQKEEEAIRFLPTVPTVKTTTPSTTTTSPTRRLSCIFVGDVYNYDNDISAYDKEKELLSQVSRKIFAVPKLYTQLALWAYGYTNYPTNILSTLNNTAKNQTEFDDLIQKMGYASIAEPISTRKAIEIINEMVEIQLNCLVFLTAQKATDLLPIIDPINKAIETIVAVGLSETQPTSIVPVGGKVVSVPYEFHDAHVGKIVEAITESLRER